MSAISVMNMDDLPSIQIGWCLELPESHQVHLRSCGSECGLLCAKSEKKCAKSEKKWVGIRNG